MQVLAVRILGKSWVIIMSVLPPCYLPLHGRYRCHIVLTSFRALHSISSIPGRNVRFLGARTKKAHLRVLFFVLVLPPGIEPGSPIPQTGILSIKL